MAGRGLRLAQGVTVAAAFSLLLSSPLGVDAEQRQYHLVHNPHQEVIVDRSGTEDEPLPQQGGTGLDPEVGHEVRIAFAPA